MTSLYFGTQSSPKEPLPERVRSNAYRTPEPLPHTQLPVVPMVYRGDEREIEMCRDGSHAWVRSIIISGVREAGKGRPLLWRVETSVIWCEDCHISKREQPVERFRVQSMSEYYKIMNPARESYRGVDISFCDGWIWPTLADLDIGSPVLHSDWEKEAFRSAGHVR